MEELLKNTANCGTMADWFKSLGRWYAYTDTPQVGDIAAFDWNGNHTKRHHVGLVAEVRNGGDTVITVEGNTAEGNDSNGGAVMERTRYRSQVTCWLRPAYESEEQRDAILARARAEIGVKESPAGSNKVKYNTWFYGEEVSGSDYPWCAVFISWVFNGPESDGAAAETEDAAENVYGALLWEGMPFHRLAEGCIGPEVKHVQRVIYARAIDRTLKVDGDFGPRTKAGVIALQKQLFPARSGEWDGVVGVKTFTAMVTALD